MVREGISLKNWSVLRLNRARELADRDGGAAWRTLRDLAAASGDIELARSAQSRWMEVAAGGRVIAAGNRGENGRNVTAAEYPGVESTAGPSASHPDEPSRRSGRGKRSRKAPQALVIRSGGSMPLARRAWLLRMLSIHGVSSRVEGDAVIIAPAATSPLLNLLTGHPELVALEQRQS